MVEVRKGSQKFYKGHFFIAFYDEDDETLRHIFDNVRDILKFMKKPITRTNVNEVNVMLYRALKTKSHFTRFLNGELLRVYIIDIN